MGELADRLAGRVPGELVRSQDWNALVEATDALTERVTQAVDTLTARLDDLDTRMDGLQGDLERLGASVDDLAGRHLDLRLSTPTMSYALGQRAEIVARVTHLDGTPPPEPRPWVDFVTVWGQLRPSGGASRAGADGRSLSVQVDSEGFARARLSADTAADLSDEVESAFEVATATRFGAEQLTIAESVLRANTPAEAHQLGAFATFSQSYERVSEPHVRSYADAYFVNNPARVGIPTLPFATTRWRDHRSTVLAMVKPDADPTTPDGALASAALQVTFRDWLGPWIVVDYLNPPRTGLAELADIRVRLAESVATTFSESVIGMASRVGELVAERGLLGRMRTFELVDVALETLALDTDPPPFLDDVRATMRQAVRVQQTLEPSQAGVATKVGQQPGIDAIAGGAAAGQGGVRSLQTSLDAVTQEVEALGRATTEVSDGLTGVRESLSNIDGKVAVAIDRDLLDLSNQITNLAGQVNEVERLYPEPVRETMLSVNARLLKVDQLEQQIQNLRNP